MTFIGASKGMMMTHLMKSMSSVKVYQVYFDSTSERNCFGVEPFIPYFNEHCSVFFENEVISRLVTERKHEGCTWFGVVSHKFLKSPDKGKAKGFQPSQLLPRLERTNPDVLSFFPHLSTGFIFHNRDKSNYETIFNGLMTHMGLEFRCNQRSKFIVLQNHFFARAAIYEDYVINYLSPAMEWLKSCEIANQKTLYKGYTFHTFILERLFMAYLYKNKHLKCETW
jgi:hypothetical protein